MRKVYLCRHKSFISSFLIFLSLILGRADGYAEELKTGDLIFQTEGTSAFSKAISESTGIGDSIRIIHVGIIEMKEEGPIVIEADPEKGVREIRLKEFIASSPTLGERPGIIVKRLTIDYPVERMIEKAKSYLGYPYDWTYYPDNDKIYCSELVYECYLDERGEHIFESSPMNFRTADGEMPEFWIELFENLGVAIPEGVLGTNPQDLSKDSRLRVIDADF